MRALTLLVAAVSTIAFTQIASAADLGRPVYKAPPLAPVYGWTGWYVGLNAGYGWENTINNSASPFCDPALPIVCQVSNALAAAVPPQFDTHPDGFIGGGQFGYNYQTGAVVWGVETDFQAADIRGDQTVSSSALPVGFPAAVNETGTGRQKIDWFGTLRGRLGWAPINTLLIYATGGLAYGHTETDVAFSASLTTGAAPCPCTGSTAVSASSIRAGWTVGGGLEWMFAPRWSLKGEYLYYDLGTVTIDQTLTLSGYGASTAVHSEAHYHGNIARIGVNYHF